MTRALMNYGVAMLAVGVVAAQPTQVLGQFQNLVDRIKLSINSVNSEDLDRVEKSI